MTTEELARGGDTPPLGSESTGDLAAAGATGTRALWLETAAGPLAAWLDAPEGTARGGVVLCPPLGIQAHVVQRAFRRLAGELRSLGFAVLRFDFFGTGDSSGCLEDVTVDGWVGDINAAVAFLRAGGLQSIGVVGLRMGALFASRAARLSGVDAFVLWDPCVSGRIFIREQQALRAISLADTQKVEAEGERDLVAMHLPAGIAAEIAGAKLETRGGPWAPHVLWLARADAAPPNELDDWMGDVDFSVGVAAGQSEFIDVEPGSSILPEATLDTIRDWIGATLPQELCAFEAHASCSAAVTFDRTLPPVRERMVYFGPNLLFGIVTEPIEPSDAPAVLMSDVALMHHIGPGRLWVELARRWAAFGVRSFRYDIRGIGESPPVAADVEREDYPYDPRVDATEAHRRLVYPYGGSSDVEAAARFVSPEDPSEVIFVGICSGAYHALECGVSLHPRAVGLINPLLSFVPAEVSSTGAIRRRRLNSAQRLVRALRRRPLLVRIANWGPIGKARRSERLAESMNRRAPEVMWSFLERAGFARSNVGALEMLAGSGTEMVLLCGRREARPFHRARSRVKALGEAGALKFHELDDIDHSIFSTYARSAVISLLESELMGRYLGQSGCGRDAALAPLSGSDLAPAAPDELGPPSTSSKV